MRLSCLRSAPLCLLTLMIVGSPSVVFAQTNVEVSQGVQFDFVNPGARSLAMGGAFVGAADDATAALTNPAGLRALSKSEISFEGRQTEQRTSFVQGGRLTGSLSNRGVDRIAGAVFGEATNSEFRPAFISAVYASASRPWAIAGYRHETARFARNITTTGAFLQDPESATAANQRYYPVIGDMSLNIVNYGGAASFKFQSCDSVGSQQSCEDRFSIGAGLSYHTFSISSLTTRYAFTGAATGDPPGSFFGAAAYNTRANYQTEEGEGSGLAATLGVLYLPHPRLQIGASYRKGVTFDYEAQNFTNANVGVNRDTAAQFTLPDTMAVGIAARLGSGTMFVADLTNVRYGQMMDGFLTLFQGAARSEDTEPGRYHAEDKRQLHFGMEHQFLGLAIAPALRLGAWYDPDHAIYNDRPYSLHQPDKDVWHITGGGGLLLRPVEISLGFDTSDRGTILSTSAVVRF